MLQSSHTATLRIALIDEDAIWRRLAASSLEDRGHRISEYPRMPAFVQAVQDMPEGVALDAVVLNTHGLGAQEVTGFAQLLRSLPRLAAVPLVLSVGAGAENTMDAALTAGASDVWLRSYAFPQLERRVRQAVQIARMRSALSSSLTVLDGEGGGEGGLRVLSLQIDSDGRIRSHRPRALSLLGADEGSQDLRITQFWRKLCRSQRDHLRSYWRSWKDRRTPLVTEFNREVPGHGLCYFELELQQIVETRITPPSPARFPRYRALLRDISNARRAQAEARRLLHLDPLTGLPNRNAFLEQLESCLEEAGLDKGQVDEKRQVGIAVIDLDRFTRLNLSLGQQSGDEVLVEVARRLRTALDSVTPGAWLARMTADEFAVIVDNISNPEQFEALMRHLQTRIGQPLSIQHTECFLTACVGMAIAPRDALSAGVLLARADAALLQMKGRGPGAIDWYQDQSRERALKQMMMVGGLYRAIERNEFLLHYQPCVDLRTRRLLTVEALIRWKRDGRLVPPGDFIPVAEETGLIVEIGDWVIERTCRQLAQWRAQGIDVPRASINIGSQHFERPGLALHIQDAMTRHGLSPGSLDVELTESSVVSDFDRTSTTLFELRRAGVTLALDDFGTGYSSLSYLTRLPIAKLKIDRSFVRLLGVSPEGEAVARAIVALARSLNIDTVAEGVENDAQVERLLALDCSVMQGFRFAKPLEADALGPWLRDEMPRLIDSLTLNRDA